MVKNTLPPIHFSKAFHTRKPDICCHGGKYEAYE